MGWNRFALPTDNNLLPRTPVQASIRMILLKGDFWTALRLMATTFCRQCGNRVCDKFNARRTEAGQVTTIAKLDLDGQVVALDPVTFADEENITRVMLLMAPLLLQLGVKVETQRSGTKRSLTMTAVERTAC